MRHCMREMDDILNLWPTVVEEFTRRKLSVASDRAPGIYGIAKRYAKLSHGHYAAGLWAPNIARGFMWRRPTNYEGPRRSPETPRLPSWSWISVDGIVDWELRLASTRPKLEVVDYDATGFGPLGATDNIPLQVRGRIRSAFFSRALPQIIFPQGGDLSRPLWSRLDDEKDTETSGDIDLAQTATATFDYPDDHIRDDADIVVFLLEVLPRSDEESKVKQFDRPAGILLQLDENHRFHRVGTFDFEWINVVWINLYEGGSQNHDERRDTFRRGFFEECPMENIVIY